MRLTNLTLATLVALPLLLSSGCSENSSSGVTGGSGGTGGAGGGTPSTAYAGNVCVAAKQAAAGAFCEAVFDAWSDWNTHHYDGTRNADTQFASTELDDAWDAAEAAAQDAGASCSDLALSSGDAGSSMESAIAQVAAAINDGLDLDQAEEAACGADLLTAAGDACSAVLAAEGAHISDLAADSDGATRSASMSSAFEAFSTAWTEAISGPCPTNASEEGVVAGLQDLTDSLVQATIVAPLLDDTQYTTLTPGPTDYLGRTYTPKCMQGDEYRYFVKRGSVNKLVMYYQGGGACWNNLTCDLPTCRTNPPEDLSIDSGGFGDLTNPDNPFKDWNQVFISYCTCDVHFGDATQEYVGLDTITVEHLGFHNSKVAEKWAREHFVNPEEIFVTGSSAGAYGAWFNGPLLHEVWPASQIHVLADAGNGVITTDFLQNEFSNWNFVPNLPDIPGVLESITEGNGMPGYTEAVAEYFPDTNWAHYSTMFDGSLGGQTGFYNIMLNGGNPLAGAVWWEASCQFGENALAQSEDIFETVPSNYHYYFGTGSRHTMWSNDKVYDDTTGGVPTVVSWVDAMLASGPDGRDEAWANVLCENCGLILDGDPAPDPLEPPFQPQGEDTVIVCE